MAILPQKEIFSWKEIETSSELDRLKVVLEILPDEGLMQLLEKKRKGRRNDYPIRAVWNSILAGIIFQHESIESLRRELKRNAELRNLCGFNIFKGSKAVPPSYVYTRFLNKAIGFQEEMDKIFHKLIDALKKEIPDLGRILATDGKAIHSYAVGKKDPAKSSDPEADWGKKSYKGINKDGTKWEKIKSWFGYNLHLIIDANHEIPLGYKLTKASANDSPHYIPMLEELAERHESIIKTAEHSCLDKGYDSKNNNSIPFDKYGIKPIIDIRNTWKEEPYRLIDNKKADNIVYDYRGNVYCYTGTGKDLEKDFTKMAFAGYEKNRKSLKYRCPAKAYGFKCKKENICNNGKPPEFGRTVRIPLEKDRRVFTPVARSSYKFKNIYKKRSSVERVNSRIDNMFMFEKHYIRGHKKMTFRISMALIIMLAMALGRIKNNQRELLRSLVQPMAA
ncbi:MAG: transposase [Nanoarchaeota archaeon]|nr:transposase [Nanoarchaeota archaeon]